MALLLGVGWKDMPGTKHFGKRTLSLTLGFLFEKQLC